MKVSLPMSVTNCTFTDLPPGATPPAFYDKPIEDMTLRDHYASLFMVQMLNSGIQKGDAPLAQMAVKRADALMTELQRTAD